jgi:hypothetical protein
MMNVHGVAATLSAGSVLALLADKPTFALVYSMGSAAMEGLVVLRRFR